MKLWLGLGLSLLASRMARAACRLENSDWLEEQSWALCTDGDVQTFARAQSGEEGRDQGGLFTSEVYASFFVRYWLSIHGKAHALYETWDRDKARTRSDRRTDQAFFQLGHPLLNSVHGAAGRLPLPFGLNLDPFRFSTPTRTAQFWDIAETGARFSLRLRDDVRLEGGATWKERRTWGKEEPDAMAIRLTQLTDLLGGTKFVASYQVRGNVADGQRWGLATLVYSGEDRTNLEWVRITPEGGESFQQIFRFGYQHVIKKWRWDFVYEDVRKDSYTLSIGCRYRLYDKLELSTQAHYRRLRQPDSSHSGTALLGLSYGLSHAQQGD